MLPRCVRGTPPGTEMEKSIRINQLRFDFSSGTLSGQVSKKLQKTFGSVIKSFYLYIINQLKIKNMGCFSFMCKLCGKPINSDSFSGENVRLTLLDKGKAIEEMQGQYDSYGRVFDKDGESIDWKKSWPGVCDLMFEGNRGSGISAAHVHCIKISNYTPTENSNDDPNQGWGHIKTYHEGNCEIYHKVI